MTAGNRLNIKDRRDPGGRLVRVESDINNTYMNDDVNIGHRVLT